MSETCCSNWVIEVDRPIRLKERTMSSEDAIELLDKVQVGRLGTSWEDEPYIVPMNFVYWKGRIYLHCANEGKKLECIANNSKTCFEVDDFLGISEGEKTCSFETYYRSVIAFGQARLVETAEGKVEALKRLTGKYTKKRGELTFDKDTLEKTNVIELRIERITGKQFLP